MLQSNTEAGTFLKRIAMYRSKYTTSIILDNLVRNIETCHINAPVQLKLSW